MYFFKKKAVLKARPFFWGTDWFFYTHLTWGIYNPDGCLNYYKL